MKRTNFIAVVLLPLLILSILSSFMTAKETSLSTKAEKEAIHPLRVSVKPDIDGILAEETWKTQPLKKYFIGYKKPHVGEVQPFETWCWMAYDSRNLYFAFLCCDPEPQKIKAEFTKRDDMIHDDWVGLSIDSPGTGQTTFDYYVNPINTQADDWYIVGKGEDFTYDFVWESGTQKTGKGYQVEMCIPLKSISYKAGKEVKMGLLFWRRIDRLDIYASWPPMKDKDNIISGNYQVVIYKGLENSSENPSRVSPNKPKE